MSRLPRWHMQVHRDGQVRERRGVALITALWLVVAITVVVLQFSLDARERRVLGIGSAERAAQRAAAMGALAQVQSRLEYALRTRMTGPNVANSPLRASDPWLDADSLYSGTLVIDSIRVDVVAEDGGARLNINTLSQDEIKTFFGFLLNDYTVADQVAQSIWDWRDLDDMPLAHGAERDDYVKAGLLALPANGLFRDVSELLQVKGITPAIYAVAAPYLTTRGGTTININEAPAPVLRILPGMSDAILAQILSLRSQGRRITSVAQVMNAALRMGRATPAQQAASVQATQRLAARATVDATQLSFTLTARASSAAQPVKLIAVLQRANVNGQQAASVQFREW